MKTVAQNILDICESIDPVVQPKMDFTASYSKDGIVANFNSSKEGTWKLDTTTLDGKIVSETPLWDDQVELPSKPEEIKSLMKKHGYTPVDTGTNSLDVKDDTKEITAKVK